ncbi:helix-turn-helix domain-containing protein [Miltoncostaea marina]|uniref:helix-turn-helix domain-containing protein n=1 Tax=Miltoncostaea marina TaxID=2843215 RepID=UPI001C3C8967|nr:helix-turn-helix domain-containing protein [Miltoncostaea marina]
MNRAVERVVEDGAGDEDVDRREGQITGDGELCVRLRLSEDDVERVARRVVALLRGERDEAAPPESPYLSVPEAAAYLRCKRQRVDDLLSQRVLTRIKEGGRTLVARAEVEAHLRGEPTGRFARRRAA